MYLAEVGQNQVVEHTYSQGVVLKYQVLVEAHYVVGEGRVFGEQPAVAVQLRAEVAGEALEPSLELVLLEVGLGAR